MSGLEVAGIVLGTLPLVISALEHYHDGIKTIQRWRRYQREREHLVRILKTEQVKLQNICEELLKGLVPGYQVEQMIREPFGTQWHDKRIMTKLRARLHDSIDVFQKTVTEVQEAMTKLIHRLGLDTQNKDEVHEYSLKRELRRAMFIIGRSTYSYLTALIRDGISDLETLTNQNVSLEPQRQQLSHVRLLTLMRDLSAGLYRALGSSLSCECSHTLNMKLVTRASEIMYSESESDRLQELDLCLVLSSLGTAAESNGIDCRGLRFYAMPIAHKSKIPEPQRDGISASQQTSTKRRIGFSDTSSYIATCSSTETLTQTATANLVCFSTPIYTNNGSRAKIIVNLCKETAISTKAASECYGIISDSSPPSFRQYTVYPANSINQLAGNRATVSLPEVWEAGNALPFMTYTDRLQLAVTVSSSFLQLYNTPWLSASFTSASIIFLRHSDAHLYENVFIRKDMKEEPLSQGYPASLLVARRNPVLLSLGFLLVEIFIGRPIGGSASHAGQPLENKFREAQSLLPKLRLASPNYFSAVSRCLDGDLHTGKNNEMGLRENAYAGIVALLKMDLEASL